MNTLFLYSAVVLIWGSTWFAIKYQLGVTEPSISVFYRFLLATAICFALARFLKQRSHVKFRDHGFFAIQGLFMFCINYILTYFSELYITSGIVAVTFTLVVYFNVIGMKVFFGKPIDRKLLGAALVGGLGVALLFFQEIKNLGNQPVAWWGIFYGIAGTLSASLGNMVAVRNNHRKIPVIVMTSWGMLYGTLACLIYNLINSHKFIVPTDTSYLVALIYLSLFGSVFAFLSYLTLIKRIGADQAAYTSVLTPIIALVISANLEGFKWSLISTAGIVACLLGQYLVINSNRQKHTTGQLI